ncbi:erythromycin esterase family protein [Streptomyces sp. NPDC048057]|uniref:erythromycin esterase family protein n=1 Tax=Streptomyces sp. NPDC048057 TaxID=3155628 RepID=UPI0033D0AF81
MSAQVNQVPPLARQVVPWIEGRAHPLTTFDPSAPLTDLRPLVPLVGDASVVALGAASRQTHELSALAHRAVRLLVEEAGFRAVALEGDDAARVGLDAYVSTGAGDPRALLAGARSFWRSQEVLDLVEWMRSYNVQHPDDPVRFTATVPGAEPSPPEEGLAGIERDLAHHVIRWHEHPGNKGAKVVYWGGLVHTANGDPRTLAPSSPPLTHRNAGGWLRRHHGPGYVSVGLTFHHGTVVAPGPGAERVTARVPAPPAEFAEAVLGSAEPAAYLLDLRGDGPAPVAAWLDGATRTRFVGPGFTAVDHAEHHMTGGSLRDWFDAVVHVQEVTPDRPLTDSLTN